MIFAFEGKENGGAQTIYRVAKSSPISRRGQPEGTQKSYPLSEGSAELPMMKQSPASFSQVAKRDLNQDSLVQVIVIDVKWNNTWRKRQRGYVIRIPISRQVEI